MKYAGCWDTEGGTLKFRPPTAPSSGDHFEMDYEVDCIRSDAAAVFHNSVPHRFRQIHNLTNENRYRTFLNFIIVDLLKPIPMNSSRVGMTPANLILQILIEYSPQWLGSRRQLDELALAKDYVISSRSMETIKEAKEIRERVQKSMVEDKQDWRYIHWSNCGTIEL
ncbi:unnamed protein product [Didymodactylos carnosus]|uniref:Uncharacterized protein n=1 Tax=Didymodactylos carnosus TaxID=1234261 RepID=A0A815EG65_9BILA|nr:unnamed protein product [Didymodactylos carnosus]CAF4155371.1 unnamed protein product [Didymodactylos carnosus]